MLVRESDLRETQRRVSHLGIECLPFQGFGAPLVERVEELAALGRATARAEPAAAKVVPEPDHRSPHTGRPIPDELGSSTPLADLRRSYRTVYAHQRQLF